MGNIFNMVKRKDDYYIFLRIIGNLTGCLSHTIDYNIKTNRLLTLYHRITPKVDVNRIILTSRKQRKYQDYKQEVFDHRIRIFLIPISYSDILLDYLIPYCRIHRFGGL